MANLFLGSKFSATNAAGAPLAGGKVYTYAAGTLNLLATYTDQAGGSSNTNPVILDANGRANIWLGSTSYRFIVKDASDVLAPDGDVDNISAAATLTDFSASSGSSLLGFIHAGTGAVAQTVQAVLRESVSVTDFGGVMDNSGASVRTANSAALLAALAVNRRVNIPAGVFWIDPNTTLSGFWHIVGAGAASTFVKGDGDLFSLTAVDNGEMRLFEHMTLINDVTKGKLFKSVGTTNRVEFSHVNFGNSNYHIYSSGGDAVSWKFGDCRFTGATTESRHFEGLWAYSEVACYTWFGAIGIRCTNGNVSTCSIDGSVFEQMDDSAIVLDASSASFEVDGFHVFGTHFEVNGKVTNNADVAVLTSAATRLRNVSINGGGFFSPTATQTVRVSVTAGAGGNIDLVNIENCCLMGAVALCTSNSAVRARNIYFQSLTMPAGVTVPVSVLQSNSGYLGENFTAGINVGSSGVVATITPPTGVKVIDFTVQGNFYNAVANSHTGYLIGKYFASGSRVAQISDVNNGAGTNQGFVATWTGTALQIANKAAMTNNQSGDVTCVFHG